MPRPRKQKSPVDYAIPRLIKDGMPQRQAVAVALSMHRRGQLGPRGGYVRARLMRRRDCARPTRARPQYVIGVASRAGPAGGREIQHVRWDIPQNDVDWQHQCRAVVQAVNAGTVAFAMRTDASGRTTTIDPDHLRALCLRELRSIDSKAEVTGNRGEKRTADDYGVRKKRRS